MRSPSRCLASFLVLCVVCCGACRKETPTDLSTSQSPAVASRIDETGRSAREASSDAAGSSPSTLSGSQTYAPSLEVTDQNGEPSAPATTETEPDGRDATTSIKTHRLPRPKHRPPDTRVVHDDEKLAEAGIHKYESKRLRLYTDIDPQAAQWLPPLVDQIYDAWEKYFGPMLPNREGTEFQMTGYIMADREKFRTAGLLPFDLPGFDHGRHRGATFWMNDQKYDYYRAHLMLHEATHCFMTILPDVAGPVWYFEGMAESFGTHRVEPDGTAHFRVIPDDKERFAGWGRITLIQEDVQAHGYRTAEEVTTREKSEIPATSLDYSWWWALCQFLDSHPRYRDGFRELGRRLMAGEDFDSVFRQQFDSVLKDFWTDWPLFATELEYGYDFERTVVEYQTGVPLDLHGQPFQLDISADRSWQPSGVLVEKGAVYAVSASGQFTVAQEPKPWVSEANGISFRYCRSRPLGMLLGAIRTEPSSRQTGSPSMLEFIPIGGETQFTASHAGTLYLRINDFPSELEDNTGQLRVNIAKEATSIK